jgi:small conductance mechanosensitive channel
MEDFRRMQMLEQVIDNLIDFATSTGIKLVISLIILLVGWKLIKLLIKVIKKSRSMKNIDSSARGYIISFISIGLKILLVITIAGYLGLEMTSILAVLASAGVAIGLALQGALGNLAGGLMILIFKPFRVGDYIDNHTDAGTVIDINIFYTVLNTIDNKRVMLPNGELTNTSIINFSMEKRRRVDLTFTTSYQVDIDNVKGILLKIASEHSLTINEPEEPFCRLMRHADNSLNFVLRIWTLSENYWPLYFDLMEQVKKEFDRQGIEIPYPQLDVHLDHSQMIKLSGKQ